MADKPEGRCRVCGVALEAELLFPSRCEDCRKAARENRKPRRRRDDTFLKLLAAERNAVNFDEMNPEYQRYLASDAWNAKRLAALKRDSYHCRGCLERLATEVHHFTYARIGNERLSDLVSLCHPCHTVVERLRRLQKEFAEHEAAG